MPQRSIRPRLLDILESIDTIADALADKRYDAFLTDRLLRMAVERAIEIISEAVRHIPEDEREKYPGIPWRNIVAIGNKLRHEYHRLDPDILWDIAQNHLAELRPVIVTILRDQE